MCMRVGRSAGTEERAAAFFGRKGAVNSELMLACSMRVNGDADEAQQQLHEVRAGFRHEQPHQRSLHIGK